MNSNYDQIPLLDIEQYTNVNSPVYVYDPYWDELQQEQLSSETIESTHSQISRYSPAPEHREVVEQFFTGDNQVGNFNGNHHSDGASAHQQIASVGEQLFKSDSFTPTLAHQQYFGVGEQVKEATNFDISENIVGEHLQPHTQKLAHQHEQPAHWIERYWVQRGGNKYWYYRYTWMAGRKMHRVYIGSVRSRLAQNKVELVREAINEGKVPVEIKQLISTGAWSHCAMTD